jgi:hypothetical protein
MNAQLQNLFQRQHQRMRELRDDALDLANTVADEVWDKFEVEIEDATADSFIFDLASSTQMALSSMLAMSYDDAFESHVLGLLERQEKELREAGAGEASFDGARIDLTGLRKSLKLRRHADELIGQAIERAKPGLIGMLFLARDPCSDAWDREHRDNARRLRRQLFDPCLSGCLPMPLNMGFRESPSKPPPDGRPALSRKAWRGSPRPRCRDFVGFQTHYR